MSKSSDDAPHFHIDWQETGAVFKLTRPAKLNSVTKTILDALSACLDRIEKEGLRTLVIIGEGEKAFCAGTDLGERAGLTEAQVNAKTDFARDLILRISKARIISVAAVNGLAFGGGLELAMACTFRIAAPHATFSLPEVKLALMPAYGGTQFLPAIVGRPRALDMMLTGRTVGAEEALNMGLISRIAEKETPLLQQAEALAQSVGKFSQMSIDRIIACVDAAGSQVTDEGMAVEQREVVSLRQCEDPKEGVRAFLEKRAPVFSHR